MSVPSSSVVSSELNPPLSVAPRPLDPLRQSVLQLGEGSPVAPPLPPPAASPRVLATLLQLVTVTQRLRSPDHGWQGDDMPTPETLLPYVSEEAGDLLEVWHTDGVHSPPAPPTRPDPPTDAVLNCTGRDRPAIWLTLDQLTPQLLWWVARSAYGIMQLIEGIRVQCRAPQQDWLPGMLRLVVLLVGDMADQTWQFDLATNRPPDALLAPNCWLWSDENLLPFRYPFLHADTHRSTDDPASQATHQLAGLQQQIISAVPALEPWFSGIAAHWLPPSGTWQPGTLRLQLGFAFTAAETEGAIAQHLAPTPFAADTLDPGRLVRLTDRRLEQAATERILHDTLNRLRPLVARQIPEQHREADLLPIITAAYQAADQLQLQRRALSLLQPQLLTDELVPKLLWQLTRSRFEVMQLLGGVTARWLSPAAPWQQGLVRLVGLLTLATDDTTLTLDLASGQPFTWAQPSPQTVLTSSQPPLAQRHPLQLETLLTEIRHSLEQDSAILAHLLAGTRAEWLTSDQSWAAIALRLDLGLDLIPDVGSSQF